MAKRSTSRSRLALSLVASLAAAPLWPACVGAQPNATAPEMLGPDQTISLDLKGVDILDVLKLLSQRSGLNFIAGPNVSGRVTIFAKDVPIWQAFQRIIEANGLAYVRQGELINVLTTLDYQLLYGEKFNEPRHNIIIPIKYGKADQMVNALTQMKSEQGVVTVDAGTNSVVITEIPARLEEMQRMIGQLDRPTQTRIYSLNYADAEKLKDKIQAFLTPNVGAFSFDARTNKAVVSDLAEVLPRIDQIIHAFDEQDGEVLIDSKLVKVELTDDNSFGVDWQQVFGGIDMRTRNNFRVLTDIIGDKATGIGSALKYAAGSGNTTAVIEALKKFGNVETVSNPRITVANNQEAKILVGTKQAFVTVTTTVPTTGSVVTSPEIQFVDVGTKLFVTPNIKRDGHVQLKIRPEVSTATIETFQNNRIPIVSTTEAETNVLVQSGTTLVIGGLIDTKMESTRSQTPVLGDIPVIGNAFRSHTKTKRKSELVVFLTPQIISASGEHRTDFSTSPIARVEDEPIPKSYQVTLRAVIERTLREALRRQALPAGTIDVSLTLGADGRIVGEPKISSPQGELFVNAAQAALASLQFPEFPKEAAAQRVVVRFRVDYQPPEGAQPAPASGQAARP